MDGVIIEYKGTNRMRIVGSAQERSMLYKVQHIKNIRAAMEALGSSHRSPITDGPIDLYDWNGRSSDIKCWKRNNNHAQRGWMRHPKRTTCKRRTRFGYKQAYYPSAKLFHERGLFCELTVLV